MDTPTPLPLVDATTLPLDALLPPLAELLRECVARGASIGWVEPPTVEAAQAFWRGCHAAALAGQRRWWVALEHADDPSSVVGTAQLGVDTLPNGVHRAEVMKVMVHPRARRRGLAEALMRQAETTALDLQRSLIVLDTLVGCDAERVYTRLGYQSCGRIPQYARTSATAIEPTHMMFKRLHPALAQVRREPHDSADALALQQSLSSLLHANYGSSGSAGFADFDPALGAFVVARDRVGFPVGCGALRPLPARGARCAEIKRMHSLQPRQGVGQAVLEFLEHEAYVMGFRELALETRHANTGALAFYAAQGYAPIEPYGGYVGRPESACLGKRL